MLILRACVSAVRQPESMRRAGQSMTVKEGWILLLLLASLLEVGQSELLKSQHSEEFSTDRPRGSRDSDSSPFPELRVSSKGWAWAGDGCSTVSTQHTWTERSTSRSASVRCCSVSGIDITCDSRDPSGTCLPAVATYAEAEQACAAAGMRLCTRGEIEDNICCGTGCGYDGNLVWTSTQTNQRQAPVLQSRLQSCYGTRSAYEHTPWFLEMAGDLSQAPFIVAFSVYGFVVLVTFGLQIYVSGLQICGVHIITPGFEADERDEILKDIRWKSTFLAFCVWFCFDFSYMCARFHWLLRAAEADFEPWGFPDGDVYVSLPTSHPSPHLPPSLLPFFSLSLSPSLPPLSLSPSLLLSPSLSLSPVPLSFSLSVSLSVSCSLFCSLCVRVYTHILSLFSSISFPPCFMPSNNSYVLCRLWVNYLFFTATDTQKEKAGCEFEFKDIHDFQKAKQLDATACKFVIQDFSAEILASCNTVATGWEMVLFPFTQYQRSCHRRCITAIFI